MKNICSSAFKALAFLVCALPHFSLSFRCISNRYHHLEKSAYEGNLYLRGQSSRIGVRASVASVDVLEKGKESVISSGDEIYIDKLVFRREGTLRKPASSDGSRDVLLSLPSFEGLMLEAEHQFNPVSESFDGWWLYLRGDDRSSIPQLVSAIISFLEQLQVSSERKCVLVGTSFGGILALAVALDRPDLIRGLVLINPATSYQRAIWPVVGNAISLLSDSDLFKIIGTGSMVYALPDTAKTVATVQAILSKPLLEQPATVFKFGSKYVSMLNAAFSEITPDTLRFRLNGWLKAGSEFVNQRLDQLDLPVLVVAGLEDRFLPSVEEAERLKLALKNCQVETRVLPRLGHAPLLDQSIVDLASLVKNSIVYSEALPSALKNKVEESADPVLDFRLDRNSEIFKNATAQALQYESIFSPIFLSIDSHGDMHKDLGGVPDLNGKPLLFVGNHQLLALDLPLVVGRLLEEKGILARGLAHPFVVNPNLGAIQRTSSTANAKAKEAALPRKYFNSDPNTEIGDFFSRRLQQLREGVEIISELAWETLEIRTARKNVVDEMNRLKQVRLGFEVDESRGLMDIGKTYKALGAVPVTPRNFYRLMKANEAALLYPGGAKEAMHEKGQDYQLFWPEESEFIRTAARFNATVIPLSAIGCADSLNILANSRDLYNLPLGLGKKLQDFVHGLPNARNSGIPELDSMPIPAPSLPSRFYFLFGEPIELGDIKTQEQENEVYQRIKSMVHGGIDYLRKGQAKDSYNNPVSRLLREKVTGKQAPSFDPKELSWRHLTSKKK